MFLAVWVFELPTRLINVNESIPKSSAIGWHDEAVGFASQRRPSCINHSCAAAGGFAKKTYLYSENDLKAYERIVFCWSCVCFVLRSESSFSNRSHRILSLFNFVDKWFISVLSCWSNNIWTSPLPLNIDVWSWFGLETTSVSSSDDKLSTLTSSSDDDDASTVVTFFVVTGIVAGNGRVANEVFEAEFRIGVLDMIELDDTEEVTLSNGVLVLFTSKPFLRRTLVCLPVEASTWTRPAKN